jgi:hypothetical protein
MAHRQEQLQSHCSQIWRMASPKAMKIG